jgi:hypothetical protein
VRAWTIDKIMVHGLADGAPMNQLPPIFKRCDDERRVRAWTIDKIMVHELGEGGAHGAIGVHEFKCEKLTALTFTAYLLVPICGRYVSSLCDIPFLTVDQLMATRTLRFHSS